MKNVQLKNCSKCGLHKKLNEFKKIGNQCRVCLKEIRKKKQIQEKSNDLAVHLLKSSIRNSYKRGQVNYNIPPYDKVKCSWKSNKQFYNDLLNDSDWMKSWRQQVDVYKASNISSDKPSIGRRDDSGDYTRDNIFVQPLGKNIKEATAKPCYMLEIRDQQFGVVKEYESMKALKEYLRSVGIPASAYNNLNTGRIHKFDNGLSIIIQTKYGELLEYDVPQYAFNILHRRYLIDESRDTTELIERNNFSIPVNKLVLSNKKIEIENLPRS